MHELFDVKVFACDVFIVGIEYFLSHFLETGRLFFNECVDRSYFCFDDRDIILVEDFQKVLQTTVHEIDIGF